MPQQCRSRSCSGWQTLHILSITTYTYIERCGSTHLCAHVKCLKWFTVVSTIEEQYHTSKNTMPHRTGVGFLAYVLCMRIRLHLGGWKAITFIIIYHTVARQSINNTGVDRARSSKLAARIWLIPILPACLVVHKDFDEFSTVKTALFFTMSFVLRHNARSITINRKKLCRQMNWTSRYANYNGSVAVAIAIDMVLPVPRFVALIL